MIVVPKGQWDRRPDGDVAWYWSRVDSSAGPDGCWPWTGSGAHGGRGYGSIRWEGRNRQATHIALLLDGRPVADGLFALHSCDNPNCVNPRHLRPGTQAENIADKVARGRMPPRESYRLSLHPELSYFRNMPSEKRVRGKSHGMYDHSLTDDDRHTIASAPIDRRGDLTRLAEQFGISRTHVRRIRQMMTAPNR